jgi:4-azaleucine resistance transporter AzlC
MPRQTFFCQYIHTEGYPLQPSSPPSPSSPPPAPFSQLQKGFAANLVVAASVAAYGSVFGLLAAQKGIGWGQLLFMNLTIFAGSAQFVMVDMWQPPLPVAEIALAVLVINTRYLLIGASLRQLFAGTTLTHKALVMHLVTDENWAVTLAAASKRPVDTYFMLGGGLCILMAWCAGSLFGNQVGALLGNPERLGLDFAFTAVFTALLCSFWRGGRDLLPWLTAAAVALVVEQAVPGSKWYIPAGGLSGALCAALMPAHAAGKDRKQT